MSGLVDGRTTPWDFVAVQLHRDEHKRHTTGIIAASKPTPRTSPPQAPPTLPRPTYPPTVLEQTRLIARAGMAARDLGQAIAANMRRFNNQEEPHP